MRERRMIAVDRRLLDRTHASAEALRLMLAGDVGSLRAGHVMTPELLQRTLDRAEEIEAGLAHPLSTPGPDDSMHLIPAATPAETIAVNGHPERASSSASDAPRAAPPF
jgi:hypothetical protein